MLSLPVKFVPALVRFRTTVTVSAWGGGGATDREETTLSQVRILM